MASPAAVLNILITANSTQANAQLAKTQATLQRTTATANTASTAVGTKLAGAAKMGAAAVGVGLVYGLGKAVAAGANFEKQMDSVGAVADANRKQMKRLEKQALSLGQKTQYSAQEVATAQEELVKGGLKLKDILGGALKASLSLAASGNLELADASTVTVNAMKLFGLEGDKAMQVADMLASAANKTTADVGDFAVALQQGGSAAKAAGYDLNDTITVLEALAEVGIKNSDAGTSMKTAFLQLLAPTSKQTDLAKKLNLQFIDQNGNLKDAAGLSEELHDALDGMSKSQQAANLKLLAGTDGFRTLNALLDKSPDKFKEFNKANEKNGTSNKIAARKMDNLAGSAEQLSGAVETLAIKVSKWINPKLRDAIDWMTESLNNLDKVGPGAAFGKTTIKATDVLFRDLDSLTEDGLYKIVAQWDAQGKTITKDQVTHWLALNKINANQADRLFRVIDRFTQNSKDAFRLLAAYMKGTVTSGIKTFTEKTADWMKDWSKKGQDSIDDLQNALKKLDDGYEKTGDRTKDATKKMAEAGEKMAKSLGKDTVNVSRSFASMADATGSGLKTMGENVNSALGAMGVKQAIKFSIKKARQATNQVQGLQTGGVIVPGQGDGDKVPALLEPGEVVLNKKAVAAMGGASRANSINSKIPRFQKGGVAGGLDFALGPYTVPPIQYAADHAGGNSHVHITGTTTPWVVAIGKQLQKMGNIVSEHPAFGGVTAQHSATGGHYDALAIDVNDPAGNEPKSWVASIARILGGNGISGAVAEKIARVLLKGPDGPLKDMGQGALDKVRDAANKFIAKQAPRGVDPGYTSVKGGGGSVVSQMGKILLANHFSRAGAAGIIGNAYRESLWNPGAVGTGGGGLFGFTTSPISLADLQAFAGRKGTSWQNVGTQMEFMLANPGGGGLMTEDYYNGLEGFLKSTNNVHDATYRFMNEWERPGIPAFEDRLAGAKKALGMFASGGIVGKIARYAKGTKGKGADKKDLHGSVSGGSSDPAWRRFMRARNIAKRLSGILGDKGRVAQIDERISMAETLASLDSSEMGSDMSPAELAKQIGLNERLLEVLTRAKKLSRSGLKELNFPKSMSTTAVGKGQLKNLRGVFGSYLTDLTGVTGKGGRIFDTMVTLDQLRNTSTATDNSAQLSDLSALLAAANARYAVSQAQYAAFDGFRAKGGSVAPGKWAIAGERGPEVVSGPATVTPISGRPSLTIEELTVYTDGRVGMKYEGREFEVAVQKVNRKQARSGARVLPGRAGS